MSLRNIMAAAATTMTTAIACAVKDPRDLLEGLNPEQRAAVTHNEGPILVAAVAGAGKTKALVHRIAYLISKHGVDPSRILAVTFSKKGADEMNERLVSLIGETGARVGTFHSVALQICQTERPELKEWTIDDRNRYHYCIKDAVSFKYLNWKEADATKIESFISLCKANMARPFDAECERIAKQYGRHNATSLMKAYDQAEEIRLERHLLGFDDMMFDAAEMLQNDPACLARWASRWDYVLQDEAQDQNKVQLVMGELLAKDHRNYLLVGDPGQCHPAGTTILTDNGYVNIESLSNDDTVKGWNRKAQKMIGGRKIHIGSRHYDGPVVGINLDARSVTMTPDHKVLARWTNRDDRETCVVYLMQRNDLGYRVGWCQLFASGGNRDHKCHIVTRTKLEKANKVWILHVAHDRTDASIMESVFSVQYGIPTFPFEPVEGARHLTRESIDRLFSEVGKKSIDGGERILRDHNLYPNLPLWPWPPQQVDGKDDNDVAYRRGTYFPVYAANILPGLMSLPLPDDRNLWAPIDKMWIEDYNGLVYSLDVEKDHSYSANGIVVLNCIFSWRGAMPEMLLSFEQRWDAKVVKMNRNYRCGQSIIDAANNVLVAMNPNTRLDMSMKCEYQSPGEIFVNQYQDLDSEAEHITANIQMLLADGCKHKDIVVHACDKCTNSLISHYEENPIGSNQSVRVVRYTNDNGAGWEDPWMQSLNHRPSSQEHQETQGKEAYRTSERKVERRSLQDGQWLHCQDDCSSKISLRTQNHHGTDNWKTTKEIRGDSSQEWRQNGQQTREPGIIQKQFQTHTPCARCQDPSTAKIMIRADGEKTHPRDIVILFRTNAQSRAPEEALLSARIPYRIIGGTNFYERKEVKDLLAYLRICEGRGDIDDVARCINAPFRYLGKAFVDRIREEAKSARAAARKTGKPINWPTIVSNVSNQTGVQYRQRESASKWAETMELCSTYIKNNEFPANILETIIAMTAYTSWLIKDEGEESTENSRVSNVRELVRASRRFPTTKELLDYIDETIEKSKSQRNNETPDKVTLTTIHRSKGMEWPCVFIVGVNEGILPHARCEDLEEERRLFYVGITRAKDYLHLSAVNVIAMGKKIGFAPVSRFIQEAQLYCHSEFATESDDDGCITDLD